jgi:dGTPase
MVAMEWDRLLCDETLCQQGTRQETTVGRSPFDSDVQKILFSGSFRRLSKKTQVHPLVANDHVHTRLTHSIEVAQVGKTLGKALGYRLGNQLPQAIKPDDIGTVVEAACLAHDLGNPPFGHGGEEAIIHWFENNGPQLLRSLDRAYKKDLMFFEGNAQGFRIICQTENHLFDGGLRLTYATLGAFLKYPWNSRVQGKKFGAFLSENDILREVAKKTGMIQRSDNQWSRHPLAYLVEAADDICYGILDLEDAVELKILRYKEAEEIFHPLFNEQELQAFHDSLEERSEAFRVNLARLRGIVFDKAVSGAIDGFMNAYGEIMNGRFPDGHDLFDALPDEDPRKDAVKQAKRKARDYIFPDPKKVEIELGSYSVFETLMNAFAKAAIDQAQCLCSPPKEVALSWKSKLVLKMLGDHAPSISNKPDGLEWSEYQCLRRVIDYVSGMTDNYAVYVASQLQGSGFSGLQRP